MRPLRPAAASGTLAPMSIQIADTRPGPSAVEKEFLAPERPQMKRFGGAFTPLDRDLSNLQRHWLTEYACAQWTTLHQNLGPWRSRLERFERMSEGDYSDRRAAPDPEKTDAIRTVFERNNDTLGLVDGFCDFAYAQARDDIFGVRPWLAATPQGQDDNELAELVTKHSQWKFDQSNLEPTLVDSLKLAVDLGTVFLKTRWLTEVEEFSRAEMVLWSKSADAAILDDTGEYITSDDGAAEAGGNGDDMTWKEISISEAVETYRNVDASCYDFKDVAFSTTAPELDIRYTDFFGRFRQGVHDIAAHYKLSPNDKEDLIALCQLGESQEANANRGESADGNHMSMLAEANPQVELVEGFMRCDPLGTGKPFRVHVIFSPTLNVLFRCDYLANATPAGMLPVFPVRCFKTPRRIIGRGFWERYEDANNLIDAFYNATQLRNRKSADVLMGFHRNALFDESEGEEFMNDPEKLIELAPDKTLADLIEFATIPDLNDRGVEMLNQMMQMLQMRTGITSAAQGELSGVPQSNTATGVKEIASRGAALLKAPIDQMMTDLEKPVEFAVHLNYANQDTDETFTWGEGRDAELLEIVAGDVNGLRINVSLTLTQSQNLKKLESARLAIEIAAAYAILPEHEKSSQRRLFIQAIASLGFNDAEKIIREGVVDPEGIMAILPADIQSAFAAFLQKSGMMPPEETPAPVGGGEPPVAASAA
jgi:hypothetical protein